MSTMSANCRDYWRPRWLASPQSPMSATSWSSRWRRGSWPACATAGLTIWCAFSLRFREPFFLPEPRSLKISVLHDPVPDVTRHEPGNEALRREVRARFGIAPDAFVIGMISKFVDRKGHRNFVELVAELARQGLSGFRYLMVGGKVEGYEKYYDGIRAFIHRNGLDSSMVLTG